MFKKSITLITVLTIGTLGVAVDLKWIKSYETLLFDTPTGDMEYGYYALNEEKNEYYIKLDNEGNFDSAPLNYDVKNLTKANIVGKTAYNEFVDTDGSIIREQMPLTEYWDNATTNKQPQKIKLTLNKVSYAQGVTFDNAATSSGSNISSLTYAHAVSGLDKHIIVNVGSGQGSPPGRIVNSITYAAVNLTKMATSTFVSAGVRAIESWHLINPPSGSNNVVITMNGSASRLTGGSISRNSVHQTNATGTAVTNSGNNTTPLVSNITANTTDIISDAVTMSGSPSITIGANQNQRYKNKETGNNMGGSDVIGSSTAQMSWSLSAIANWAMIAVPIKPADTTPPVLSSGAPSGTLPAGTASTTLSLVTNENATCRYSTTSGTAYSSMTNTFTTTGATSHSTTVSGLTNGNTYNYYVRCQDTSGNANTNDFTITFSVGNVWFVSPTGSSSGTGSITSPWDINTAFSGAGGIILPNHTVYLRGGTYASTSTAGESCVFCVTVAGTTSAPVKIMAYQGERVTLDGGLLSPTPAGATSPNNIQTLNISGAYVWIIGVEITSTATETRLDPAPLDGRGPRGLARARGVNITGTGSKLINSLIHNTAGSGIFVPGNAALGMDIYGTLIWDNGWWNTKGHGHGMYLDGNDLGTPRKVVPSNYVGMNFGDFAFQVVGGPNHFDFDRNIILNRNIVGSNCSDITITNNYFANGAAWSQASTTCITRTGNIGINNATGDAQTPTTTQVFVESNTYDANRAHIVTYNPLNSSNLNVDISALGWSSGSTYELRSVLNYYGDMATGTLSGSSINVNMNASAHSVTIPLGSTTSLVSNLFPGFGAFVLIKTPDTTPPVLSSGSPSGTLPAGTASTTLSLVTNENATCRYSTTSGTAYSSMTNTFTTTGATSHSTTVSGLTNGNTYNYYVRCQDGAGNANTTDFAITFSIANLVITLDASSNTSFSGVTSVNLSHTVGSGSNRLLIVGASYSGSTNSITALTYGGVSLTKLTTIRQGNANVDLWYLVNPTSGANTVSATFSATAKGTIGVTSWTGVNQTTPLGTHTTSQAQNTSPSVSLASASNEIVHDVLAWNRGEGTGNPTATIDPSQTQLWNVNSNVTGGASSNEAGAASTTMSWTLSVATNWAMIAVPLKP